MKKVILIIAVLTTSHVFQAQTIDKEPTTKNKTEYSYLWGLFKSKGFPKSKSVVILVEKPEFSTSLSKSAIVSTKYEQKSILWGAIQWTEKKKSNTPVKSQSNGK